MGPWNYMDHDALKRVRAYVPKSDPQSDLLDDLLKQHEFRGDMSCEVALELARLIEFKRCKVWAWHAWIMVECPHGESFRFVVDFNVTTIRVGLDVPETSKSLTGRPGAWKTERPAADPNCLSDLAKDVHRYVANYQEVRITVAT